MCQNPMQTMHQNKTMGLGRIARKSITVTKTLSINASERRSAQWRERVLAEYLKDSGNTDGKPMDVRPCAERGRKSVKFPMRLTVAHPPVESLI